MNFLRKNKNRLSFLLICGVLILIPLYLFSCAGYETDEEYGDPEINVLISPETLNNWITNGYPVDEYGYNKVVVLFVGMQGQYGDSTDPTFTGHLPGSYLVDILTDISATRNDGVSDTSAMVAAKSQMDDIIQRTGIDGGTVIVLTAPSSSDDFSFMSLSRAYFNFRYWGFPRNRVRVLDGFVDTTWTDAGYGLQSALPPAPAPSDYSVCNLTPDPDRFRAPLEEMINIAKDNDPRTVVIDSRTPGQYNGSEPQTIPDLDEDGTWEHTAFSGHIRTAVNLNYTNLLAADGKLFPKTDNDLNINNDLESIFANLSVNPDKSTTVYTYCMTSWRAAITFLALDGVLNYPVKLYDGSWLEWGQMSGDTALMGRLAGDSPWRTDYVLSERPIIIDNNTKPEDFTYIGYSEGSFSDWGTSDNAGNGAFYGADFRANCILGANDWATWRPQLPSPGWYDVSILHTAKVNFQGVTYATDAGFTINHNSTNDLVTVNLQQNGGRWFSLGTYYFIADDIENVTLTDNATFISVDTCVVADAVRFTPDGTITTALSEDIAYNNSKVEDLTTYSSSVNSFALRADKVNREDTAICTGSSSDDTPPAGGY